jgi:hypothetical protein
MLLSLNFPWFSNLPDKQQVSFVIALGVCPACHAEGRRGDRRWERTEGSVALSIATRSMVADRRYSGTIYKMSLIDRLRLRSGENLLETRIASERVPFPPQTKISQRDVIRKIRVLDCARSGKNLVATAEELLLRQPCRRSQT